MKRVCRIGDGREAQAFMAGLALKKYHKREITSKDCPYWVTQHDSLIDAFFDGALFRESLVA